MVKSATVYLEDCSDIGLAICHNNMKYSLMTLQTKQFVDIMITRKEISSIKSQSNIANKLHCMIIEEIWKNIYFIPRIIMYNNVSKDLQYKKLHRYLPTNRLLYKMKKIGSDKCNFCGLYLEDKIKYKETVNVTNL